MVETITYAKVLREDLDIGVGTREIRLQDGSLHTLNQISGQLAIPLTEVVTADAGQVQLQAVFGNPSGTKVHGVTVFVPETLGNSNGLTSFDVGDAVLSARWGQGIGITANTETSSADFQSADEPIVSANYTVLLTQNGGNFDGNGTIHVQLHFSRIQHIR
ncbi:MAG: hypothetical protein ACR2QC_11845 [Gammaproteobacteria bacterium]